MRLISWNVNGLRSLESFPTKLAELDADIICIQETRLAGASDPDLERFALIPGYSAYFSFCVVRGGYSGVATFVRDGPLTPVAAGQGLSDSTGGASPSLGNVPDIGRSLLETANQSQAARNGVDGDESETGEIPTVTSDTFAQILREGRVVITDHERFVLVNVYIPAESVAGRSVFKIQFLLALQMKITALQSNGRKIVLAGDLNICPNPNDMADRIPSSVLHAWYNSPKRVWLRHVQSAAGLNLVDSFRELHPNVRNVFTCWSELTRARENNFGVRIDLILVDRALHACDVRDACVLGNVQGSDHCPVSLSMVHPLYLNTTQRREPPQFCAKNLARFGKRQSKLFFRPISKQIKSDSTRDGKSAISAIDVLLPSATSDTLKISRKRNRNAEPHRSRGDLNVQSKQQKIGAFFKSHSQHTSIDRDQWTEIFSAQKVETVELSPQKMGNMNFNVEIEVVKVASPHAGEAKAEKANNFVPSKSIVKSNVKEKWEKVFKRPPSAPICRHGEPCKLKCVGKAGPNKGRTFWSCARAGGQRGDREANCHFFQWAPFVANKPLPD